MPGVHVAPQSLLTAGEFTPDYTSRTVVEGDPAFGYTAHPSYPVTHLTGDGYDAVVDGMIYEAPVSVRTLVEHVHAGRVSTLRDLVPAVDGSFVVVVRDAETGAYRGVNDVFARLPLYYLADRPALGREPTLLARQLDAPALDPEAVAQTLVFRYPLGQRTPVESLSTLPPGSFFEMDDAVAVQSVHEHDFAAYRARESATLADLRERFLASCRRRCLDDYQPVLSLSGGLDSRAVAGGYHRTCPGTVAASFTTGAGASATDADLAGRVAAALDLSHEVVPVTGGPRYRRLQTEMLGGMNSVHMAPQLEFAEAVAERWDRPFVVTGDGGDKLFPDLQPDPSFDSVDELARWVVDEHAELAPAAAADLTGVSRARLDETVAAELAGYPEDALADRYVHFLFRNRGFNWLNVGEDRTRHFAWSDSPFYSLPLFEAAMSVSPARKRNPGFYPAFIADLDDSLTAIPDADLNAPIDSLEYRAKQRALAALSAAPRLNRLVTSVARLHMDRFDATRDVPDHVATDVDTDPVPLDEFTRSAAMDLYTVQRLAAAVDATPVAPAPARPP